MSIKPRLDYFLMRGGLLVKGDTYDGLYGDLEVVRDNHEAEICNDPSENDSKRFINSFAPRKNNGSQPVPDDFPVRIILANRMEWRTVGAAITPFCAWYPDIEKLIEQQVEYDKAKLKEQFKNGPQGVVEGLEKPIEELIINARGNKIPTYTQEMKEAGGTAPIGSNVQIINTSTYDLEYGDDILGLEVTVKSEPIYIGLITKIQVVEYEGIAYCFETDMIFPFKSKEEIEMEKEKLKRVNELSNKYVHLFSYYAHPIMAAKAFFIEMQENGELAEIILPLEHKQ